MKDFRALLTHAGTYTWQIPYVGEDDDSRQQGVRFSIETQSQSREAALAMVAANLADLGEDWLHPAGSPDGPWILHLDRLPQVFPSLATQRWLQGNRLVAPEFDTSEADWSTRRQKIGIVRLTALPEDRAIFMSVPPAPELQHFLGEFRRDHPDPARCGFLMMPFTNTPLHNATTEAIRATCTEHGLMALRADDHRYSDDLLPNIRTYMHGSAFGIAVFERLTADQFNPNVSLEVGYMMALGKPGLPAQGLHTPHASSGSSRAALRELRCAAGPRNASWSAYQMASGEGTYEMNKSSTTDAALS